MVSLNPAALPLMHLCDLNFTLSKSWRPTVAPVKEKGCCCPPFRASKKENFNDSAHIAEFLERMQWIGSSLHQIEHLHPNNPLSKSILVARLSRQISGCLKAFNRIRSTHTLSLKVAQAVYGLAQDLKRHSSLRSIIWNYLPQNHRTLLHRLSPWTEDLKMLNAPLYFQWLEDGHLQRARQDDETLSDFGQGRLFRVLPPFEVEDVTVFPLSNYPSFHLLKTSTERTLDFPSTYLDCSKMGRIQDLFDTNAMQNKIEKAGEEDPRVYKNQLITLFTYYRAALCSVFNLSIAMPKAMGVQGEWSIWPNARKAISEQTRLTEAQLALLHRFFLIEKRWRVNLLCDDHGQYSAKWALSDEKLEQEGVLPLPAFFGEDIESRHGEILERFMLDGASLNLWKRLEDQTEADSQQLAACLDWLQDQLDRKLISIQDLLNPSPQLLSQIISKLKVFAKGKNYFIDQNDLDGRLVCLRKAAFLPQANRDAINQRLQSLLHDAMVKRSSQLFLKDFEKAIAKMDDVEIE